MLISRYHYRASILLHIEDLVDTLLLNTNGLSSPSKAMKIKKKKAFSWKLKYLQAGNGDSKNVCNFRAMSLKNISVPYLLKRSLKILLQMQSIEGIFFSSFAFWSLTVQYNCGWRSCNRTFGMLLKYNNYFKK